jgi:hypothetical protein
MAKLSEAERKKRKMIIEQKKRDKIKSDPVAYAKQQEKERLRYLSKKQRGVVKPIETLTQREKRAKRKEWRGNAQRSRSKKQLQKRTLEMLRTNTPDSSSSGSDDDVQQKPKPSVAKCHAETPCRTPPNIQKILGRKKILKNRSQLVRDNLSLKRQLALSKRLTERYKKKLMRAIPKVNKTSNNELTPRSKVKLIVSSRKVNNNVIDDL